MGAYIQARFRKDWKTSDSELRLKQIPSPVLMTIPLLFRLAMFYGGLVFVDVLNWRYTPEDRPAPTVSMIHVNMIGQTHKQTFPLA